MSRDKESAMRQGRRIEDSTGLAGMVRRVRRDSFDNAPPASRFVDRHRTRHSAYEQDRRVATPNRWMEPDCSLIWSIPCRGGPSYEPTSVRGEDRRSGRTCRLAGVGRTCPTQAGNRPRSKPDPNVPLAAPSRIVGQRVQDISTALPRKGSRKAIGPQQPETGT